MHLNNKLNNKSDITTQQQSDGKLIQYLYVLNSSAIIQGLNN